MSRDDHADESVGSGPGTVTSTVTAPSMDCPNCGQTVERALSRVNGVETVDARPTTGSIAVGYDPDRVGPEDVREAVESAGYEVTDLSGDGERAAAADDSGSLLWSSRGIKTWIAALLLAAGLTVATLLPGADVRLGAILGTPISVADALFLAATAVGGQVILRNGYYSTKNRSLDMDFLMSAAIVGAVTASLVFAESLYFEAATLAVLVNVAELLERRSMDRARDSMRELMDLAPQEATVRRDGEWVTVPVGDVAVGERVRVRPGERIPVDGRVRDGESAVDQSPVTGEGVPVDKTPGEDVYAGTFAENGALTVEATAPPGEDTLSRVIALVENARAEKTRREQFVERFADVYTPLVVALAVVVAVGPPVVLGGAWATWFLRGLTVLVLACPCAFVIATPVTVVSGITSAARNGVLIKGGTHLESVGDAEVVAFDKTGTLTAGELTVTDVVPLNGNDREEVLACARGLESMSEHPIGEAIAAHAAEESVPEPPVSDFEALAGRGVRATVNDELHYAGKPGMFADLGFDLSHVHAVTDGGTLTTKTRSLCERNDCVDLLEEVIPALQSEGKTVVLVGTESELEGVVALADRVRPETASTVERLGDLGVERTVMLTGDNERTARAVGDAVGVDEVRAELLPDEKVEAIRSLDAEYDGVAMVGDGINDAPALAGATVGIAMGAAGTDTAIETADVALMGDDLSRLPYLRSVSMRANRVVRQNVVASLAAKGLLAAGVPFGLVPIWLAVLAGDAGMTVGVTANAMRLSGIDPEASDGPRADSARPTPESAGLATGD